MIVRYIIIIFQLSVAILRFSHRSNILRLRRVPGTNWRAGMSSRRSGTDNCPDLQILESGENDQQKRDYHHQTSSITYAPDSSSCRGRFSRGSRSTQSCHRGDSNCGLPRRRPKAVSPHHRLIKNEKIKSNPKSMANCFTYYSLPVL